MGRSAGSGGDDDPLVSCEFQGGTLSVYEDRVTIERTKRSMFEDTTIPIDEIEDVQYSRGVMTGHIQICRAGVAADTGGLLSHPIDENTLHFPRTGRSCAAEARDAILARATAE